MALVMLLADYVLPESDDQPFVKLILMIESAVPSADTIIVVVQQAEKYSTAEALAACYLLQYIFGRTAHLTNPDRTCLRAPHSPPRPLPGFGCPVAVF